MGNMGNFLFCRLSRPEPKLGGRGNLDHLRSQLSHVREVLIYPAEPQWLQNQPQNSFDEIRKFLDPSFSEKVPISDSAI